MYINAYECWCLLLCVLEYSATKPLESFGIMKSPPPPRCIMCSVSKVSKVTGYGLDNWVSVSGKGRDFLRYLIQTGCGAYPVSIRRSFPEVKMTIMWSWPSSSTQCQDYVCVELPPFPSFTLMTYCLGWEKET